MAKEKFESPMLYLGPLSSFSVVTKTHEDKGPDTTDRPLVPGQTYDDLPKDHPVINNLIAGKMLIPATDETPPEASPKKAVADSSNTKAGDDRSTSAATQEGNAK